MPSGKPRIDAQCAAATELAREAAVDSAGVMGVGDYLSCRAEDERVVSHFFDCPHQGFAELRGDDHRQQAGLGGIVAEDIAKAR